MIVDIDNETCVISNVYVKYSLLKIMLDLEGLVTPGNPEL